MDNDKGREMMILRSILGKTRIVAYALETVLFTSKRMSYRECTMKCRKKWGYKKDIYGERE